MVVEGTMPWQESSILDSKLRFIVAWQEDEVSFAALCREHAISRKTGYKLIGRYEAEGLDGLKERSRAPRLHPNAMAEGAAAALLDVRRAHPSWGGEEDPRLACRSPAGRALAGREHDLRAARSAWSGSSAQMAPPGSARCVAADGLSGKQRRLGHGFQGLVSHRRWTALRPLQPERSAQPLCVAAASNG